MKVLQISILILLLVVIGKPQHLNKIVTFSGKVFDKQISIERAKIVFQSQDGKTFEAKPDSNGFYKIRLPQGLYKIEVSDCGFPTVIIENIKVTGNKNQRFDIEVCGACIVDGCGIIDESKPLKTKNEVLKNKIYTRPIERKKKSKN